MKDFLNCTPALIELKLVQLEEFLFTFVAASMKKSFHISVMNHNAECNLYLFAEAFNGIASCRIFFPFLMFHHFTVYCI